MNIRRAAALAPLAALLPLSTAMAQNATSPENADLRREIDEQKQRLAVLERKLELADEAAKAAAAAAPRVTASATRFQIASQNGENFVRLRGTLHADNRVYSGDSVLGLSQAFAWVAEELRRQYSLGYYPSPQGREGLRRQIKVRVNQPNLVVAARDSYIYSQKKTDASRAGGEQQFTKSGRTSSIASRR